LHTKCHTKTFADDRAEFTLPQAFADFSAIKILALRMPIIAQPKC
jgi:hypothetical protein